MDETTVDIALLEPMETDRETDFLYMIRDFDGYIAVFSSADHENPEFVTNIMTKTLRSLDQLQLKDGIFAKTGEDMLKLLEDFGS